MPSLSISAHARSRMQQRAIPPFVLDLLWDYGSTTRVGGADSLYFDRVTRARAADALRQAGLRGKEHLLDAYAVVADDGTVVTTAWRTGRLRRR